MAVLDTIVLYLLVLLKDISDDLNDEPLRF
jgi:hypothetical protein